MKVTIKNKRRASIVSVFLLTLAFGACTNINQLKSALSTTNSPSTISSSSTNYSHTLLNTSIIAADTTNTNMEMTLTVKTNVANFQPLVQFCSVSATGTSPCVCEIKWTEINTVGGASNSFERTKRAPLTQVQNGAVKCLIPRASAWDEIADGTILHLNIVAIPPNTTGLLMNSLGYKKGSSTTVNGDFIDDTLTPFRNIYRYTCASRRYNTFEILSRHDMGVVENMPAPKVFYASRFCNGTNPSNGICVNPRSGFSAQSYYRNLYVRSDMKGLISGGNSDYECPKVEESIRYSSGTDFSSIPPAERNDFWPMDTTFSLATSYSTEWSIPIRAGTAPLRANDPNIGQDYYRCAVGDPSSNDNRYLDERGKISYTCLGYAKKPKLDGTCGTITDNSGRVRPLVRLRKYRAIFPPTYEYKGAPSATTAYADEIYVADRMVVDANGVPTNNMIYGPKPCNYSWFDHEGVTNQSGMTRPGLAGIDFKTNFRGTVGPSSIPKYVSTSMYEFRMSATPSDAYSVNPDGRILPNRDRAESSTMPASCSAAVSIVDYFMGQPASVRLMTTNEDNSAIVDFGTRRIVLGEVHVNPIDPWSPNYVEDKSFQACAPLADPYLEPPLAVYKKDANTMGWCSKVYPTQNPYWTDLNASKRPTGALLRQKLVDYNDSAGFVGRAHVKGFTSHLDTNGTTSVATPATLDDYNKCGLTADKNYDGVCTASTNSTSGTNFTNCQTYLKTGIDEAGTFNFNTGLPNARACNRTILYSSAATYRTLPLQSNDDEIKSMLANDLDHDRGFSCQYSVHSDPTKVNARVPASGCCGVLNGNPILKQLVNGAAGTYGHLEPFLDSTSPTTRFCGNPVQ